MGVYYMDTKEFLTHFVSDMGIDNVLNYQYVIISNTLKTNQSLDNITRYNELYPTASTVNLFLSLETQDDPETYGEFIDAYWDELDESKYIIGVILKYMFTEKTEVIFINSPTEARRIPYMEALAAYIEQIFGVPVYNYKKLRKGECKFVEWDMNKIKKEVLAYVSASQRENADMMIWAKKDKDRETIINDLSKKDVKKLFRRIKESLDLKEDMGSDDLSVKQKRRAIIAHYNRLARDKFRTTNKSFFVSDRKDEDYD